MGEKITPEELKKILEAAELVRKRAAEAEASLRAELESLNAEIKKKEAEIAELKARREEVALLIQMARAKPTERVVLPKAPLATKGEVTGRVLDWFRRQPIGASFTHVAVAKELGVDPSSVYGVIDKRLKPAGVVEKLPRGEGWRKIKEL
jgi:hypothetical protein